MREEVQVVEESPVDHGQSIHRVLLREGETPGSGFTAVNGDLHRLNTTFRPEEHVRQGAQEPARTDSTMGYRDMAQNRQQHSWRSADRNDSVHVSETGVKSSPGSMKRKRSQEPADDAQRSHPIVTGRESPKRRHTDMGQDALPRLTESALNGANDELRSMEHMLNPSNRYEAIKLTSALVNGWYSRCSQQGKVASADSESTRASTASATRDRGTPC